MATSTRRTGTEAKEFPEYALAGSYTEFMQWRAQDPKSRGRVTYLDRPERAEGLLAAGAPRGVLHRIGTWETSPARVAAEGLEGE